MLSNKRFKNSGYISTSCKTGHSWMKGDMLRHTKYSLSKTSILTKDILY